MSKLPEYITNVLSNSSGLYISMLKCYENKTETLYQKTPPWCGKTLTCHMIQNGDTSLMAFQSISLISQQEASIKVIQGLKNMSFQHLNLFLFLCNSCDQEVNDQVLHTKSKQYNHMIRSPFLYEINGLYFYLEQW